MKKTIIVVIVLAIVGVAGYLGWRFLGSGELPGRTPPDTSTSTPPMASAAQMVVKDAVLGYWTHRSSGMLYYIQENGGVFRMGNAGEPQQIGTQTIPNLRFVRASRDGTRALISYGTAAEPFFTVLDVTRLAWQPLPQGTASAALSPEGNRVAYLRETRSGASSLVLADLSTTTPAARELLRFYERGLELSWPLADEIYLSPRPTAGVSGELWRFDVKEKTLRKTDEGAGLSVRWSEDGRLGIAFSLRNGVGALSVIGPDALLIGAVALPLTLPEKCTAQEKKFYCATPRSLPENAVLPDDYYKRKVYTEDDLYMWDSERNKLAPILVGNATPIDAEDLSVSGRQLLFINRYDRKLYSVSLQNAPTQQREENEEGAP